MQKKPIGESRIPTDFWSGLGFSKSMPDSAIREKLCQYNAKYHGPMMTTTYEVNRKLLMLPISDRTWAVTDKNLMLISELTLSEWRSRAKWRRMEGFW